MLKEGMFIQGRYEIVGKIGTGGMADVYKAKDHKLNRFVAMKVLKVEFREDKAFITKFRAEAQAAAGLAHPNIVNIYDVGEDRGVNFIVMELVEGITLKEYIAKKGKLAVREATSIAIQVSQGLEAAHNSGIIHRDVKPQNIIISTDGKVKVTDFGIARATSSNTISTTVMGSVHYSSPEQARGGYSDAKSDIYSLGITMYEMLTGHVPFDGDTTVAIAIKHLQEEMKSPEVYVPDLPRSTVQIIWKCTQKSPDRRYANMSELIYDLKESLINPDGDFVRIANANTAGRTVVISKQELGAIKEGYLSSRSNAQDTGKDTAGVSGPLPGSNGQNIGQYNTGNMGQYGMGGAGNIGQPDNPYNQPYEPYTFGRAYGNRGYDYQEDMYENGGKFQDEDDNDGILNPKLEKIMMVGSIVIAIIIAGIFLGLIANALGIIKFSLPGFLNRENGQEVTTESRTEKETQPQTSAVQQETTAPETQAPQSETTAPETQAPQSETTATEDQEELNQGEDVDVPNVENYTYEDAYEALMQAGFYVERQDDPSNDYPAGTVMEQSVIGTAKRGTTIILIVSSGPESVENTDANSGTWMCSNIQLDTPEGYNGETARLVLQQGESSRVILDGVSISFPYDLNIEGEPGQTSGEVYLYVLNQATGQYEPIVSYTVPFEQVN
ncbi:MAG: protein kinase [Eubacteriales bacterium]|nr:protein kinase [Eubacteriales bacterium]